MNEQLSYIKANKQTISNIEKKKISIVGLFLKPFLSPLNFGLTFLFSDLLERIIPSFLATILKFLVINLAILIKTIIITLAIAAAPIILKYYILKKYTYPSIAKATKFIFSPFSTPIKIK